MSAAVAVLGAALLCWPNAAAPSRVRAWTPGPDRGAHFRRLRSTRPPALAVAGVGVAVGALLAGVGGAVAAGVIGATLVRTRRAARTERERAAATAGLAEGLGSFAAEVRAGSPPAVAAETAAADAHPVVARTFGLIAATARLGGEVPAALRSAARANDTGADHLSRLAAAWALAERHGIALAGPVEAVAVDLRTRARVAGRLRAQLAGPRATAVVLAALPVLGIGLGEGIGAHPWAVLTGRGLGQVLLVVGVLLACAGVLWTGRIAAAVAR